MITVEIVTPERVVHKVTGVEALLPTVDGEIGVRKGHVPLISILKPGQIIVKQADGSEELYAVGGGFVEILGNTIHILADSAERAEELNEARIQEAITRAQQLKEEVGATHAAIDASAQLEANLARLKVVQRRKARGKTHIESN
jgi:F-type H+-transporting ATPase subunit epsilon